MTKTRKILIFVLALLFGILLSGCGGKTGGGDDNTTSNQWDQMSWDQGKWG